VNKLDPTLPAHWEDDVAFPAPPESSNPTADNRIFEHDLDDYRNLLSKPPSPKVDPPTDAIPSQPESKADHRQARQLQTRMNTLMSRIDRLSAKLKDVEAALADPDLYACADHPDLQQLPRNQLGLIEDIEAKEQEWLGLSQQLETIGER